MLSQPVKKETAKINQTPLSLSVIAKAAWVWTQAEFDAGRQKCFC